jgi:hypothetical protein
MHLWVAFGVNVNPLNAGLNPICHLLALLRAYHILQVSRIRVNTEIGCEILDCTDPAQDRDNSRTLGFGKSMHHHTFK